MTALEAYIARLTRYDEDNVPFKDLQLQHVIAFNKQQTAAEAPVAEKTRVDQGRQASEANIPDEQPLDFNYEDDDEVRSVHAEESSVMAGLRFDLQHADVFRIEQESARDALKSQQAKRNLVVQQQLNLMRKEEKAEPSRPRVPPNARNDRSVSEAEEIIAKQKETDAKRLQYGDRVVFFDLEWHRLDKKPAGEITAEYKNAVVTAHICQICAISANHRTRFNQYLYYRRLQPEWMDLVRDGFVQLAPQDDPRIALSVEDALEQFIAAFPVDLPYLFLSYGNTDVSSLFKTLMGYSEWDKDNNVTQLSNEQVQRRRAVLKHMVQNNWQWGNVMPWIKSNQEVLFPKDDRIQLDGQLGKLWDKIFHHSIMVSLSSSKALGVKSAILEEKSASTTKFMEQRLTEWPKNMEHKNQFGLVPRYWLEVVQDAGREPWQHRNCYPEFWQTSHLEPVFHVAHTDTLMTLNCVAMLCLAKAFKLKYDKASKQEDMAINDTLRDSVDAMTEMAKQYAQRTLPESASNSDHHEFTRDALGAIGGRMKDSEVKLFNCAVTSVQVRTLFLRKFQLALSEEAANEIWTFYQKSDEVEDASSDEADPTTDASKADKTAHKKPLQNLARTSAQVRREVYVKACIAANLLPNDEGDDDMGLYNHMYEVDQILRYEQDKHTQRVQFEVRWKNYKKTSMVPFKDFFDEAGLTADDKMEQFKRTLTPTHRAVIEAAEKEEAARAEEATSIAAQEAVRKEAQGVLRRERRMERAVMRFENPIKETDGVFLINANHTSEGMQADIAVAKRTGHATEKLHAIRRFMRTQAQLTKDPTLLSSFQQYDVHFSLHRQLRFPLKPKKDYSKLPWFTLATASGASPRTDVLHLLSCRNILDPTETNRNLSQVDATHIDFDVLAANRVYVNQRFRFCKECKQYTNEKEMPHAKPRMIAPPVHVVAAAAVAEQSKARPPVSSQASQTSLAAPSTTISVASSVTVLSRHTMYTLKSTVPAEQVPLTELVSYFALSASSILVNQ